MNRSQREQPLACPRCGEIVDVRSRHVAVRGSSIEVFCSDACLRDAGAPAQAAPSAPARPRRRRWWIAAGAIAGGAIAALSFGGSDRTAGDAAAASLAWPAPPAPAPVAATAPLPAGPPAPTESPEARLRREADAALLEELKRDAWIHPLAGPVRRMSVNHVQAFGAARAGVRRPECLSGHCGVDIGGVEIWGEPVLAVHDGVVAWVHRGPNEDNGGVFVKIAHRGGTLFSWYFHLAAVPRWVQPGAKVAVGRVIGLVGDTGVKRSAPHLHFAMTVKRRDRDRERYIDPEPLLAIWPLWIRDPETPRGRLMTAAPPGLPVRAPAPRPKQRAGRPAPAAPEPAPGASTAATPGSAAASTPAPDASTPDAAPASSTAEPAAPAAAEPGGSR
jgi:murein DD-endopeptidase MepM/ murein hydrolase activator NlpD